MAPTKPATCNDDLQKIINEIISTIRCSNVACIIDLMH
jgi:hypothetical protein